MTPNNPAAPNEPTRTNADLVLAGATLITMDEERRVILDGALAIKGNRLFLVGPTSEVLETVDSRRTIDAQGFIVAPGFLNGHVHVTGDPLTRHYMADNLDDSDKLANWVIPRYSAHEPGEEKLSAKFCALELLKSGTTTFLEAGTIRYLDEVVEGLSETGIRGRVGSWVEGRAFDPNAAETELIRRAIITLESEIQRYPDSTDALISAWPILVGHNTNPDEVWKTAKAIAEEHGLRVAAHMSPYAADPEWFLSHTGKRPVEHLADIGVLGPNLILTHATHLDSREVELMAESGTNVAFCPFAALKGAFGVAAKSRYIEMIDAGVDIMFATDGYDAEILPVTRLGAALFKDLRGDVNAGSALTALERVTIGAAKIMGLDSEIGSLEVGKRADFVCFDKAHFQWRPLLSPLDQLVWSADARSLHSVWVNGRRVIDGGRSTLVDEDALLREVQAASEKIISRSRLPFVRSWPTTR